MRTRFLLRRDSSQNTVLLHHDSRKKNPVMCMRTLTFIDRIRFVMFLSILSASINELISSDSAKTLVHYVLFCFSTWVMTQWRNPAFISNRTVLSFFFFFFPNAIALAITFSFKMFFFTESWNEGKKKLHSTLQVVNLLVLFFDQYLKRQHWIFFYFFD